MPKTRAATSKTRSGTNWQQLLPAKAHKHARSSLDGKPKQKKARKETDDEVSEMDNKDPDKEKKETGKEKKGKEKKGKEKKARRSKGARYAAPTSPAVAVAISADQTAFFS
jgi:hypothetical protein